MLSKTALRSHAARPLYGTWAAAPYLHNGSVPTSYHLLLPPEPRPKTFALGKREYDPVRLGFTVDTACAQQDRVSILLAQATEMVVTSGVRTLRARSHGLEYLKTH
jgi:hypothetical protein